MAINFDRVPAFYHNYIRQVKAENLGQAFEVYPAEVLKFLQDIPEEKWSFRYAEGKWTIREMVQHIIDAERIFTYRALCFARKEKNSLPGFDENEYVVHSKANHRSKNDLLSEFQAVQDSSKKLFLSFDEEQLETEGIANGSPIYVRALGYITLGHPLHHRNILMERYLK